MMRDRLGVLIGCGGLLGVSLAAWPAQATEACAGEGGSADSAIIVEIICANDGGGDPVDSTPVNTGKPRYDRYMYSPACVGSTHIAFTPECQSTDYCPDPNDSAYVLFGLDSTTGTWRDLGIRCVGPGEEPTPEATPAEITPGVVLRALRRLGLPEAEARTQPEGTTLVNFDTIFYADAEPQTRDVTLLGRPVTIEATPVEFVWHHGDGTSRTTAEPGAPYPARDITHRYASATDEPLAPRVDVTYRARFRVADGPWRPISETVTVTGPPGSLLVSEATPVLTR